MSRLQLHTDRDRIILDLTKRLRDRWENGTFQKYLRNLSKEKAGEENKLWILQKKNSFL